MKFVVLVLCFLCVSLSQAQWFKAKVRIGRDDTDGASNVFARVEDVLNTTSGGIVGVDLADAAKEIASMADSIKEDVSSEDVDKIISEVSASFNGVSAVSALFDDDLTYESRVLQAALALWDGLVKRGRELKGEGKPVDAVLAAISKTAGAIHPLVEDIAERITYQENSSEGLTTESPTEETVTGAPKKRCIRFCIIWLRVGVCARWSLCG
ncbi:uncharacterized protein LOC131941741 [Physella acuta]|uniref:uncharacterized protein LOC131941741 n=1 Tax=Physella acuta TaxID=109671 RepID=UPI0027DBDA2B|nr:uncharacterized protein LOC131941741 [Physella acuta]